MLDVMSIASCQLGFFHFDSNVEMNTQYLEKEPNSAFSLSKAYTRLSPPGDT